MTKYDTRNDPSWHVKNRQVFDLSAICTAMEEGSQVGSLDDLNLESKGVKIRHEILTEMLDYLNGKKTIGQFSGMSSMHRQNQGQRSVTKVKTKMKSKLGDKFQGFNEQEARDRRLILDSFDKQFF